MSQKFFVALLAIALAAEASVVPRLLTDNTIFKEASTKIVGGRPAIQGEAPYQLAIRLRESHLCGASLVEVNGTQLGVTAAHCITEYSSEYVIIAGDINNTDITGIEQFRTVNKVVVHEKYSTDSLKNDIALLFFNQSFQLNENVSTVPLPKQGEVTSEGNLKVSGWGELAYQGKVPEVLQIVELPLVNDTHCQRIWQGIVDENMICANGKGDTSPCRGDSGGPAISDAGYLAGVVSWGYPCGHPEYPAVFTKVANFIDWIHATVGDYQNRLHNL